MNLDDLYLILGVTGWLGFAATTLIAIRAQNRLSAMTASRDALRALLRHIATRPRSARGEALLAANVGLHAVPERPLTMDLS